MAQIKQLIGNGGGKPVPNGSRKEPARVLAELTGLGKEDFGFAEVLQVLEISVDCAPEQGQGIYLLKNGVDFLRGDREHEWKRGDAIVILVIPNSNEEHKDTTPLAGVRVFPSDPRSVCRGTAPDERADATAGARFEGLKEKIARAMKAWREVDPKTGDPVARKAAEDLRSGVGERDPQRIQSALGRLEERVGNMLAETALPREIEEREGELLELIKL